MQLIKDKLLEAEILKNNTIQYLKQIKQCMLQTLTQRLEHIEKELTKEIQKEVTIFKEIQDFKELEESFEKLKEQLKKKLDRLKSFQEDIDVFQVSTKIFAADPLLLVKQSQQQFHIQDEQVDINKNQPEREQFFCKHCNKEFTMACAVRVHMRIKHFIESSLFCPQCPFKTGNANTLALHLLDIHFKGTIKVRNALKKVYQCYYTKKKFTQKEILSSHVSVQREYTEKEYQTNGCQSNKVEFEQDQEP